MARALHHVRGFTVLHDQQIRAVHVELDLVNASCHTNVIGTSVKRRRPAQWWNA